MKVLLLRRQLLGGMATWSDTLSQSLPQFGIAATVEEASGWIPNETDISTGRRVSKKLRARAKEFDLVHAFGYRSAWACAEAFGSRFAWLYGAYDLPKTTHHLLIDSLNEAQTGICASAAVKSALSEAGANNLELVYPAVADNFATHLHKLEAQAKCAVKGSPTVVCLGRLVDEHGFESAILAMASVWDYVPDAQLIIAGDGGLYNTIKRAAESSPKPNQIHLLGRIRNSADVIAAADLFVAPHRKCGFSLAVAEAMKLERPVLARQTGGLREMIQDGQNGSFFETDEELGLRMSEALQTPKTTASLAHAAKIQADAMFAADDMASRVATIYKSVLTPSEY